MKPNSSTPFDAWLVTLIWCALVGVGLTLRPLLPIDETRYITVAWEMYQSGDYWVPTKNGELYSHKPPFFFWLMNLGWSLFGLTEGWARLVAPLFGLASVFVTVRLARALWPEAEDELRHSRAWSAALILITGLYWTVFSTMTMFDMMVTFAAVVAVLGYILAWRGYGENSGFWKGIVIAGVGIGVGGLAKGPAILVHTIPLALAAPLWGPTLAAKAAAPGWGKWYAGVLASLGLGAGITLAWAIPAAIIGGEEYRNAIFIKQSTERMVESFAHRRPVYWFLWVLPLMLLPWALWPRLLKAIGFRQAWKSKTGLRASWANGGVRVVLIWAGASFVIFSAISGKQPHYLLPIFPALALFAGFVLNQHTPKQQSTRHHRAPVIFIGGLALLLMVVFLAQDLIAPLLRKPLPEWTDEVQPWWLLPAILIAFVVSTQRPPTPHKEVRLIASTVVSFMVLFHFAAAPALNQSYNLAPTATQIKAWHDQGRPVAYIGKYHGEFQFLGRLTQPMTILDSFAEGRDWATQNPTGIIIATKRKSEIPADSTPRSVKPYRGRYLVTWDAANF